MEKEVPIGKDHQIFSAIQQRVVFFYLDKDFFYPISLGMSEEELKTHIEANPTVLYVTDDKGKTLWSNPSLPKNHPSNTKAA